MRASPIGLRVAMLAALTLMRVAPAPALDNLSQFDFQQTVTLRGTVQAYEFGNPHTWLRLNVASGNGQPMLWSILMAPPTILFRFGWRPSTLKPGDQVTVVVNPKRDGSAEGSLVSAAGADGKPIGTLPTGTASAPGLTPAGKSP